MAKPSNKPAEITWSKSLDADFVREAFAEATVDANDDIEQHMSLYYTLEDELAFPFPARVLDETVSVVGIDWPQGDEFGIDLICERNGQQQRVEARSVELLGPLPDGHLFLAAYLAWRRSI